MLTITRELSFDAAHRVWGHEGKCADLHGHHYVILAELRPALRNQTLDTIGRILDFSVMKSRLQGWVDDNWDHNTILFEEDPIGDFMVKRRDVQKRGIYIMQENPTVENLVQEFYRKTRGLLPQQVEYHHIKMYETPKCCADYYVPDLR